MKVKRLYLKFSLPSNLRKDACLFELVYGSEGTVSLRAQSNGKFVGIKSSGPLVASSAEVTDTEKFRFKLSNRPNLVLKGEHGFVGLRKMLECNRTSADNEIIQVTYENDGTYIFRGEIREFDVWYSQTVYYI